MEWVNINGADELIFSYQKEENENYGTRQGFQIYLKCDVPETTTSDPTTSAPYTTLFKTTTEGTLIKTSSTDFATSESPDDTTEGTTITAVTTVSNIPEAVKASGSIATTIEFTDELLDENSQGFAAAKVAMESELKTAFESTDSATNAEVTVTGFRKVLKRKRRSGLGGTVVCDFVAILTILKDIITSTDNVIDQVFNEITKASPVLTYIQSGALENFPNTVS